jgi:hypothetical protein
MENKKRDSIAKGEGGLMKSDIEDININIDSLTGNRATEAVNILLYD